MSKSFPRNPNLRHFKDQARDLQKAIKAGDASARDRVKVAHPRYAGGEVPVAGGPEGSFSLSDAQLTVAREYGFASWGKLRDCTLTVERYGCRPHDEPARLARVGSGGAAAGDDAGELANDFLRLACLTYGVDSPERRVRAVELLRVHPEIAEGNIFVQAVLGDVAGVRALLAGDAGLARAKGGPHGWEPLLYLTYGRVPVDAARGSAVEVARVLLAHGADANAGFLWDNEMYVFTALTGVLGEGEAGPTNQPRHPEEHALARLLLETGADANDAQGLYNRQFTRGAEHLELLQAYGLGKPARGPWFERLGGRLPEPEVLVRDQLMWAAEHGHLDRVRLLVGAGVALDEVNHRGRTAYQVARLNGYGEIAEYLVAHGATGGPLATTEELCAALAAGDRARVAELRGAHPGILENISERRLSEMLITAAGAGRIGAAELLLDVGVPVNAMYRVSALHEAAWNGQLEMARLLVARGADGELRDPTHNGRPVDWARHNGQVAMVEFLEAGGG